MKTWLGAILILFIILTTACTKKQIVTKYYTLDSYVTADSSVSADPVLPLTVRIKNFHISDSYSQNRIVVRTNSNEISYYYYHKWAEGPDEAIRLIVWKQIKKSNIFESCLLYSQENRQDYYIVAFIDQIERIDIEDQYAAHLKMTLEYFKTDKSVALINHSFDRYLPLEEGSNMNLFAQNIKTILSEEITVFIYKIRKQLKNDI